MGSKTIRRRWFVVMVAVVATVSGLGQPGPTRASLPPGTHWIGVRPIAGNPGAGTELYDRRTDRPFVPRGVNLLRAVPKPAGGFDNLLLDPSTYDGSWVEQQLDQIVAHGYNTVRVFLDHCPDDCLINPDGTIKGAYLDILSRFLTSARDRGLVVMPTLNDIFRGPRYLDALPCCDPYGGYLNSLFFSGEGLNVARTLFRDLIGGLQERGAPLEAVLAWSLQNEQFSLPQVPPLSLTSGFLTTGNGETYDLSNPDARIELAEENAIYWSNQLADTVRVLDPTTLVTMGFFAPFPESVPATTLLSFDRLVRTIRLMQESNLDFYDFHAYPGLDLTLPQITAQFGMRQFTTKPVVMGEVGAFKIGFPTATAAAPDLVRWQVESCGLGWDGWLGWSWGWQDPDLFQLTDDGGAMATALSPNARPNPCASPPLPTNVALRRPVTVTSELPDEPGIRAVDGLGHWLWNSGAPAPGSITIDLGTGRTVHEVRLLTSQDPAGPTTHRIDVRKTTGPWKTEATLTGFTTGDQWLRYFPPKDLKGIRWVRIVTTASPSWVSWREVQVWSPPGAP